MWSSTDISLCYYVMPWRSFVTAELQWNGYTCIYADPVTSCYILVRGLYSSIESVPILRSPNWIFSDCMLGCKSHKCSKIRNSDSRGASHALSAVHTRYCFLCTNLVIVNKNYQIYLHPTLLKLVPFIIIILAGNVQGGPKTLHFPKYLENYWR